MSSDAASLLEAEPITVIPFEPGSSQPSIFARLDLFEQDDVPSIWRQQAYEAAWDKAQARLGALTHDLYQPALRQLKERLEIPPTYLVPATALDGMSYGLTPASQCDCLVGGMAADAPRRTSRP